jgi:hypothetical protein
MFSCFFFSSFPSSSQLKTKQRASVMHGDASGTSPVGGQPSAVHAYNAQKFAEHLSY